MLRPPIPIPNTDRCQMPQICPTSEILLKMPCFEASRTAFETRRLYFVSLLSLKYRLSISSLKVDYCNNINNIADKFIIVCGVTDIADGKCPGYRRHMQVPEDDHNIRQDLDVK